MPAVKPYNEHEVGKVAQTNYAVLEQLFDLDVGQALRNQLFGAASEANLQALLEAPPWKIVIPPGVRIMVVDIENARTKTFRPATKNDGEPDIDPREDFYVLVLPPVPRREAANPDATPRSIHVSKETHAWSSAWYHAITDGYGM